MPHAWEYPACPDVELRICYVCGIEEMRDDTGEWEPVPGQKVCRNDLAICVGELLEVEPK